jgi:AraC family transcriptional activator of pobA
MGIRTAELAVYPVSIFHPSIKDFWFDRLERLLEKFPVLEHPHKHSFYMILFVEKANGNISLDRSTIRLDEPKIICIKPNSVFSLDINRAAKGWAVCFTEHFFSLRYNNNVLYHFAFLKKNAESYVRLTSSQTDRWRSVLQLMSEETENVQPGIEKVLRSYLNILLFDLDRKFKKNLSPDVEKGKADKIIQFELLVEAHFISEKKPSFYAQKLHITTNYLNKLCHEYRNVTSGELIRKRIIIEAQRLLHYTTSSVAEVAYKLGFESSSYFITFFKKYTGNTPEYFRKNNH